MSSDLERDWRWWKAKAEQAEAKVANQRNNNLMLLDKLEQAEAEVGRLKCCGNCDRWCPPDSTRSCDQSDEVDAGGSDPCHFTPSRWTARAEEGSES